MQNPVRTRAPFALQRKEYHYCFSLVLSLYQAAIVVPLLVGANYHHIGYPAGNQIRWYQLARDLLLGR